MPVSKTLVRAASGAALSGVVAMLLLARLGGPDGHRIFAVVPDADGTIGGLPVRSAGQTVGGVEAVSAIRGGRAARIRLRIDDDAWPLPGGTTMQLRAGGTIVATDRFVELTRGRAGEQPIADGDTLPTAGFSVPVEFDRLVGTFTTPLRRDFKAMTDASGAALGIAEGPFRRALDTAPAAVTQTSALLGDLESRVGELDTLVRSTDSVVHAIHRADPGIGTLVSAAATTFDATASRAQALEAALGRMPRTLAAVRGTLRRTRHTLEDAGDLTDRLRPGVGELRALAAPLDGALRSVVAVGPDARVALGTARRAAPSLDRLLKRATDLMPQLGSVARQTAEQLKCIRPYTPDIVAFFSLWGDWFSNTDGKDRYARMASQGAPYTNAEVDDSAGIAKRNPQLTYAFPQPPGYNANQPWFLPECGIGREVLDPSKDPEARPRSALRGGRRQPRSVRP